ncbi:MAG: DUF6438 domain-containing protein [Anaerolineae bacterium]|nr:DUF6438 domain-containing protein [Anaerolineae bacterium]
MRRDISRLLFLLALFGSFACSTLFPPTNTIPEDISDAVITLERTACFGFCPDYTVTIYGDGRVVYFGNDFVAEMGERTYTIPTDDVLWLVESFYDIGFFDLDDRYVESATDLPSTTISMTIEGETKSIYLYGMNLPKDLVELTKRVDEVANTKELIGR